MSTLSVQSCSDVSYQGETVSAEKAIDESIKDLQDGLNSIHNMARRLLMADIRGDSYQDMFPLYKILFELVKEDVTLLKDFQKIIKQLLPTPKPRDFDEKKCMDEFKRLNPQ